jgi:segregation and condensation protein A
MWRWPQPRSRTTVRCSVPPEVDLREVLLALKDVMARAEMFAQHHIQAEPLSVRERMSRIISLVSSDQYVEFDRCFDLEEGRMGAVVTFLAMLELLREHLIDLVQQELFGNIYVRAPSQA